MACEKLMTSDWSQLTGLHRSLNDKMLERFESADGDVKLAFGERYPGQELFAYYVNCRRCLFLPTPSMQFNNL